MLRAFIYSQSSEEEQKHTAKALEIILWTLMTVSLLLFAAILVRREFAARGLWIVGFTYALYLPVFRLNQRGRTSVASVVLIVGLWGLISGVAITGGGIATTTTFVYIFIVFAAGLLLGVRAGLIMALLCILTTLGLVIVEMTGYLPSKGLPYSPIARWIALTLFTVIMLGLQYLAARTVREALQQTRRELEERKRAEENTLKEKRLTEAMLESLPGIFYLYDEQGNHLRWNQNYERATGRSAAEVARMHPLDKIADEEKALVSERIKEVFTQGESSVEADVVAQDGSRTPYFLTGRLVILDDRRCLIGMGIDITERRQAEERIRLLQIITMDVAAASDLPAALAVVLRHVCEKTGWALGQAWIPSPDGTALDCCPAWFATEADLESFREMTKGILFSPGCGLPGRVWESRQPAWVRDVTLDENFQRAEFARQAGLKAGLAIPILSNDEVLAVLEFFLREPRDEDERLVEVITAVAAQIGLVVEHKRMEDALRESENLWRTIFNDAAVGIALVNTQGSLLQTNSALQRMLGYTAEEMQQLSILDITHPDDMPQDEALHHALTEGRLDSYQIENRYLRKDGQIVWGNLTASLVRNEHGQADFGIGMVEDVTERKQAEQQLKATTAQLRALTASLDHAREEERTRIAREIHDELGGALTSLRWDLEAMKKLPARKENHVQIPSLDERIASMLGLIDTTIQAIRRISSELRPSILDDLGLVEAITWQAQQFQTRTGILCECKGSLETVDLNHEQSTAVFRIFQETLTNVLRHAQATRVDILIEQDEKAVVLTIRDNGKGITENEATGAQSLGLLGMRERAHLIGGEFNITGSAGKGTVVTVRVPLSAQTTALSSYNGRGGL